MNLSVTMTAQGQGHFLRVQGHWVRVQGHSVRWAILLRPARFSLQWLLISLS